MQRISMLGSGFIGRFYADSLQGQRSRDKIVSIYSRREESAQKFAADYQVPHWTTDMEASIAHPDVDVVCISLPNNLHEAAVLLCCKHKKGVICTKPLGRNAEEAKRMLEAVEKAGIFNGYLEDLVYTPKFLKALDSVKNGALGRILWAKSRETHPGPHSEWFWDKEQAGGGCILVSANAKRTSGKDGDNKYSITKRDGKSYSINHNGERSVLNNTDIIHTVAELYFFEPHHITSIFSELQGAFLPLRSLGDGLYELTLPEGKKNVYKYEKGTLVQVEIPQAFGKALVVKIS